ncbi:hypothetical protein KIW84_070359 [Lathyrus oleraceus]|uniref:GH16 domain-containing protein n=1 Tax=Pisum sativum TaxID=3888 RepID=A0A9D4VFV6_PEA|nr:hypothetical protein KIW84_070359 [Pisum sativum]
MVPVDSAGTVTAVYLSSQNAEHDEIDFEFLGNRTGQSYILQTNVFTGGQVGGNMVVWKGAPTTQLIITKLIAEVFERNNLPGAIFTDDADITLVVRSIFFAAVGTPWSYQESTKQEGYSSGNNMMQGENNNTSMQIYSPEFANVQMNTTMMNNNGVQSDFNNYQAVPLQQVQTLSKKSDDGFNWRKYGQKKTSEKK